MARTKKEKAKNSKRYKFGVYAVIVFLLTLAVTGIYFGVKYDILSFTGSPRTINLPTINTKVKSSSSGEEFYMTTDITLEFERSKNEPYNDIYAAVKSAVSGLDYDRVCNEDFTYFKESINQALSEIVNENAGMSIYITNYQSDREPIINENTGTSKMTLPVIP